MGIFKAITDSVSGALSDQWRDVITAGTFTEQMVVAPGLFQASNNGRGPGAKNSAGVITVGSKVFVPENTAAFIFNASGIEAFMFLPGEYIYEGGEDTVFDSSGNGFERFANLVADRFEFGGQPSSQKCISFVNLREIRGIRFGTSGPVIYHDLYYDADLEIMSHGSFSVRIVDPERFIRNFLPANSRFYSFEDEGARSQMIPEFLQSFLVAVGGLSSKYRLSQLPAKSNEIANAIKGEGTAVSSWASRFGFEIVSVAIQGLSFSKESSELVRKFSENRMNVAAYNGMSQDSANMAAQQKIAQGVEANGLGDAGVLLSMGMASTMDARTSAPKPSMSIDEQVEALKKMKELVDMGILTEDEFNAKKREIMGL